MGWFRAKLLLRSLREPPAPGSLQEWVLTLVLLKEEEIEQARELAFAQLLLDMGKALEAWQTYQEVARPYVKTAQETERKAMMQKLLAEVGTGPLVVQPLWAERARSRLRDPEPALRSAEAVDQYYGRLGAIIRRPR